MEKKFSSLLTQPRHLCEREWRWLPRRDLPKAVSNSSASIECSQEDSDPNRRAKAIWDFEGINCSSRHIPGVKFAGLIHPGILGCAPSAEVLNTWNEREAGLIKACSHMDRDVALPPQPKNVHAGSADADIKEKVGKEGARTVPGRPEHGGNCDIKNLSRGSKVYLPVHVKGAKFSVGDLHFSQGDGEISFCGAIEMAGVITINFSVMKGGMEQLAMKSPIYVPGPVEPQFGPGRYIYFEGFSVDEHGKQHYLDATVAYRQTCLRVIEYLRRYGRCWIHCSDSRLNADYCTGYDDYQIYLLLSCAPVQGHIAGIVDIPNACTTLVSGPTTARHCLSLDANDDTGCTD
jgi:formamidase